MPPNARPSGLTTLRIETPRVFLPLLQDARYKGAHGGRGSGKSHHFAESLVEDCLVHSGTRAVCIREVQKTLKESAKRLIEDKIEALGVSQYFNVKSTEIETPGGGVVIFQGMQDHTAESIKSLEGFDRAWCEEAQTLSARSLELLRPTIRAPGSQIWFSWNPRSATDPVDALLRGEHPPEDAIVVRANYSDNPFFPKELEAERSYDEQHKRDRYGHIWLGEYEPMAVGAIWDRVTIHNTRRDKAPVMGRILVGVDPAGSSAPGADEHGIIVGGRGEDNEGYVLDDLSTKGPPRHWAERACAAYDLHNADAIVCETNYGGEMVANTIKSVRPDIRVIEVRATRGKHVRAEPIAALYSLGRVHHVGTFPILEDQMCATTSSGYEGDGSPDRMDAMVWVMTELFPSMTQTKTRTVSLPPMGAGGWMG
jgi:hypothetical protein